MDQSELDALDDMFPAPTMPKWRRGRPRGVSKYGSMADARAARLAKKKQWLLDNREYAREVQNTRDRRRAARKQIAKFAEMAARYENAWLSQLPTPP